MTLSITPKPRDIVRLTGESAGLFLDDAAIIVAVKDQHALVLGLHPVTEFHQYRKVLITVPVLDMQFRVRAVHV